MDSLSVYDKNKLYLQHHFFGFPDILQKDSDNSRPVKLEDTRSGEKTIRLAHNGKEKYMHSKYDPVKEAERWVKEMSIKNGYTVFVFGLGLAYHVEALFDRTNETNAIFVVEPDAQIANQCLETVDLTRLWKSNRVFLLTGGEDKVDLNHNFITILESRGKARDMTVFIMPTYQEVFDAEILSFFKIVKQAETTLTIRDNTGNLFNDIWQVNTIKNLDAIASSYSSGVIKDIFKGKTAISIGGGPSLDKNIHLLKGLEDKAVLLATDTVAKALYERGIKPHMLFTVDPQCYAFQKFYSHVPDDAYDDIPLMYLAVSAPDTIAKHKGKKILTMSNELFTNAVLKRFHMELAYIKYHGSVACLSFAAADFLGCDKIVFIGQDLALTGNMTHATGTIQRREAAQNEPTLCTVKDIYGNDVQTLEILNHYRVWLEDEISVRAKRDITFIDATEGGAYIQGTKIMTLQEVIDRYCTQSFDFYKKLAEVLNDENRLSLAQRKEFMKTFFHIKDDLQAMEELIGKGKEQVRKIRRMYDHNQLPKDRDVQRALEKLQEMINQIDSFDDALQCIYFAYKKRENPVEQTEKEFEEATQKDKSLQVANEGENLFRALEETIQIVLPALQEKLEKLDQIYVND